MTSKLIATIDLFEGAQGKYYIVDGVKYHYCFPVGWAMTHSTTCYDDKLGPIACSNCEIFGTIRGVFVGYCTECIIEYNLLGKWRANNVFISMDIKKLSDKDMWIRYPWMHGISQKDIGDAEDVVLTDRLKEPVTPTKPQESYYSDYEQDEDYEQANEKYDDKELIEKFASYDEAYLI
jgi:hypothetical protein